MQTDESMNALARRPAGRPSVVRTKVMPYIDAIAMWRRMGEDEMAIAERLGITPIMWRRAKRACPELVAALAHNAESTNAAVVAAMQKSAVGYDYDERTVEEIQSPRGTTQKVKCVRRHARPNPQAARLLQKRSEQANETNTPNVSEHPQITFTGAEAKL